MPFPELYENDLLRQCTNSKFHVTGRESGEYI